MRERNIVGGIHCYISEAPLGEKEKGIERGGGLQYLKKPGSNKVKKKLSFRHSLPTFGSFRLLLVSL